MTKAKTPKTEAEIALFGGPADGRIITIESHDELEADVDGVRYERTDGVQGGARIYRYAPA